MTAPTDASFWAWHNSQKLVTNSARPTPAPTADPGQWVEFDSDQPPNPFQVNSAALQASDSLMALNAQLMGAGEWVVWDDGPTQPAQLDRGLAVASAAGWEEYEPV